MLFQSQKIADLTGADCFILALSRMMKRDGQHGLVGQTLLRMEGIPDINRIREGAHHFGEDNPLLDAFVRRNLFTFIPAWHALKKSNSRLSITLWHEKNSPEYEDSDSNKIESIHYLSEYLLNRPLDGHGGFRNLRLDLVLLEGGGSTLLFTWNHLLFDGKGVELLVLSFIDAMNATTCLKKSPQPEMAIPLSTQFKKARPAVDRFFSLVSNNYRCLSGAHPTPGHLRYQLLQFTQEETLRIHQRSAKFSGLFTVSFYLACAARAHREVFLSRGNEPLHYVSSIPVQLRRKGGIGDPFQNRVTVLFFSMKREELETMQSAVQAAQTQFEELTRLDIGTSFSMILSLMRRLPSVFYMKFLGNQFSGEITSFFHSATGAFLGNLGDCYGAQVIDAYHVPSVSAPPGSGLFFGEFHGRLTATFSWREGAVSEREMNLLLNKVKEDLIGKEPTELE